MQRPCLQSFNGEGIFTGSEASLPVLVTGSGAHGGTNKGTGHHAKLHDMELCPVADSMRK